MSAGYSATPLLKKLGIRDGMRAAFVDVKVCAVDEDWSGLKLVRRLEDRT